MYRFVFVLTYNPFLFLSPLVLESPLENRVDDACLFRVGWVFCAASLPPAPIMMFTLVSRVHSKQGLHLLLPLDSLCSLAQIAPVVCVISHNVRRLSVILYCPCDGNLFRYSVCDIKVVGFCLFLNDCLTWLPSSTPKFGFLERTVLTTTGDSASNQEVAFSFLLLLLSGTFALL